MRVWNTRASGDLNNDRQEPRASKVENSRGGSTLGLVRPFLKWVGGKRQLLPAILPRVPETIGTYFEPFVGGGAVVFAVQPEAPVLNDANPDLIEVYSVIRDDLPALIDALRGHVNTSEHFYAVREWDRDSARFASLTAPERAARLIYLNKTCYNGLYRVNAAGRFNTPFGNYTKPNIVDEPVLRAVGAYLRGADARLMSGDYAASLASARDGDFVYLDPPYDPVSTTANFTGYIQGGFGRAEQVRLRETCDALDARGVRFLLSNSATDFIRAEYADYTIDLVQATRAVNSKASGRGPIDEVLVRNF